MANRTRKRRREIKEHQEILKRRMLDRVTDTDDASTSDSTETTDSAPVRGLLEDPHRIRSDLVLLRKYMGDAFFTKDEFTSMVREVGAIVKKSDDYRVKTAALRAVSDAVFKQLKLHHEVEKSLLPPMPSRHNHAHLHLEGKEADEAEEAFSDSKPETAMQTFARLFPDAAK